MPASNPLAFGTRNRAFILAEVTGGRTRKQVLSEVDRGGKFVVYQYVVSALIVTFRRNSKVLFVPPGKSVVMGGLPYSLLSVLLGWWGFPWGLFYTPTAIYRNFAGGTDVNEAVCQRLG